MYKTDDEWKEKLSDLNNTLRRALEPAVFQGNVSYKPMLENSWDIKVEAEVKRHNLFIGAQNSKHMFGNDGHEVIGTGDWE